MAKAIKFNLKCDGQSIRTLEDLRDNFSVEDVLELYRNKLLHRWLSVRGYDDILEKVEKITDNGDDAIITKLIQTFEIEADVAKIKEDIEILQYLKEREELLEVYNKSNYKLSSIIDDYYVGYRECVKKIIANKDDMPIIKATLKEIVENYYDLFRINYKDLYHSFEESAPMAIFAMLTMEEMRNYYLVISYCFDDESILSSPGENKLRQIEINKKICKIMAVKENLSKILGDNLKVFSGNTEAYWKDVEPKGKKYMILKMISGNFIRNAAVNGEELSSSDITNNFVILNGIDYKSNNASHELLYMEV